MSEKVFLAGATGAVGSALIPLLRNAGYAVYGSTRRAGRAAELEARGVHPVVVDVFDAAALNAALVRIAPWGVVHQLTDLPKDLDPKRMAEAAVLNARVRTEGTRNLVAAATAAGARRLVAQSIAWAYAPGAKPFTEVLGRAAAPEPSTGGAEANIGRLTVLQMSSMNRAADCLPACGSSAQPAAATASAPKPRAALCRRSKGDIAFIALPLAAAVHPRASPAPASPSRC